MSCTMYIAVALILASAVAHAEQKCSSGGGEPSDDETPNVVSLLQSQLQMNALEVGGEAMLQPACAERKLVINSHVKYGKALDRLVASLKEHKFPLKDCVVFRGGASISAGPHIGADGMTFVDLTVNSYDLNALSGLSTYKNHSLVCADMYFLIHDSAQVGPCFPKAFDDIKVAPTEIITPGTAFFSNQCVFGRSVVDKFGDDFNVDIDKGSGLLLEAGVCIGVGNRCPIDHYASEQTVIPERVALGDADVYHTSLPRRVVWYQEWDLYKFILWGATDSGTSEVSKTDLALLQQDHKSKTDLALLQQDHKLAPSCSRKVTVEDIVCKGCI